MLTETKSLNCIIMKVNFSVFGCWKPKWWWKCKGSIQSVCFTLFFPWKCNVFEIFRRNIEFKHGYKVRGGCDFTFVALILLVDNFLCWVQNPRASGRSPRYFQVAVKPDCRTHWSGNRSKRITRRGSLLSKPSFSCHSSTRRIDWSRWQHIGS